MLSGEYTAAFVCYGYKKDPNNKHKLIIDEEACDYVGIISANKEPDKMQKAGYVSLICGYYNNTIYGNILIWIK